MASIDKVIEKMRRQPRGISYNEAVRVLNHFGFELIRKRGSHRVYADKNGMVIVLKQESPLKISYITEIVEKLLGE